QVGWKMKWLVARKNYEAALPSKTADKQPKLKNHVVANSVVLRLSHPCDVSGSKYKQPIVRGRERFDQSLKDVRRQFKNALRPDRDLCVALQRLLRGVRNFKRFLRRSDEKPRLHSATSIT